MHQLQGPSWITGTVPSLPAPPKTPSGQQQRLFQYKTYPSPKSLS